MVEAIESANTDVPSARAVRPVNTASRCLYLLPITLLAFVLRFLLLAALARRAPLDGFYLQATELAALARSIILHHELTSPFGGSTGPSAFLAPGYPFVVAIAFRIFGDSTRAAAVALVALQSLFNVGTVAAMMIIARRVSGNLAANIAGLFWAVSLPLLWIPIIFWETSFSLLALTVTIALFLRCAEEPSLGLWTTIGAGCGIAMLVNPSLLTVFMAGGIWTAIRGKQLGLRGPATAMLICALLFAPWSIRNLRVMHAIIPFRTNLGYELWQGNRPESDGFFSTAIHPNVNPVEFSRYASLGEVGYMREKSILANDIIRKNPVRFLGLTVKRFARFWSGRGGLATSPVVLVGHILLTTLLGAVGLILMFWRKHPAAYLFAATLILFPLPYYFTHSDPRFRLVVDPLVTILGAYTIAVTAASRKVTQ